jgi:tetratricopeptide (TPR) repeat protein
VLTGANVYGGWRQLLFVYPPMVIMASTGIFSVTKAVRNVLWRWTLVAILVILIFPPIKFMVSNHPYYYTYFNPLAGGTAKAYGNYELDYYFTGYKEAYEWIEEQTAGNSDTVRVATNFLIPWYYQDSQSNLVPVYFDYYMRGNYDWDYAVVPCTFLSPYQIKMHIWPPQNTVKQVRVSGVPVCIVIKREQYYDLKGFRLLQKGRYDEAEELFVKALKLEPQNETALLNLSRVFYYKKDYQYSEKTLDRLLKIYPGNEWALDLLGEIRYKQGEREGAIILWEENIDINYKFYHSYVNLSKAYMDMGMHNEALSELIECLHINPFYKPALVATGNWYLQHGEEGVAERYFRKASN